MAFDEARYQREVLDAGLPVNEGLAHRYQLAEPLTASEVADAVRAVRACWRRLRTRLRYRAVIEELEAAHLIHQPLFAAAGGGDLAPLDAAIAEQRRGAAATRRQLNAALTEAAGGIGLIDAGTLRQVGAAYRVDAAHVEEALRALPITVATPDQLPREVPLAYARCGRHLAVLRLRHLADFLTARAPGEHTSDPVRPFSGGAPGERELEAAAARWARLPHSAAHTTAQAVVVAARKVLGDAGPAGLRAVLLNELAEPLRVRRAARAAVGSLLRHAVDDLSVATTDAHRLVFAVLHESVADPLVPRLRALVADGLLVEAAALLDRFPAGTLPPEAATLAEHVRATLAKAERQGGLAAQHARKAPDLAWTLLDQAEALVRDLPRIGEVRRSLPVRPVPRVRATADRDGVLIEWEPTPSTAGQPRYLVVRRAHRAPRSGTDGTVLTPPEPDATSLVDTDPPVNTPVHYAVAVRRAAEPDGPMSPLVAGAPVRYRPEVRAAALEADDGAVTGTWRLPAEAESVRVTRRSGGDRESVAARRDGFTERGLRNGVAQGYLIQAVYRDADGTESITDGIGLSATPLGPPEPVTELAVVPVPEDPALFEARFRPPAGEVRLYAFDAPPPWPVGQRLRPTELAAHGARLAARPCGAGLRFRPPRRATVVVAATVAGDRAMVGAHELVVATPPLRRAAVTRGPGEAVVTFDWPLDGPNEAELTWRDAGDAPRQRTVTRLGYLHQAGARLPVVDGAAVEIEVRLIGRAEGLRAVGPPTRLVLPTRIEISYTLARRGPPGRASVRAVFTSAAEVRVPGLVLVGSPGPTWPLATGDGEILGELADVALGPGHRAVLTARLPRGHRSWLRCFAVGDGIVLVDPPTRQLRMRAGREARRG